MQRTAAMRGRDGQCNPADIKSLFLCEIRVVLDKILPPPNPGRHPFRLYEQEPSCSSQDLKGFRKP